MKKLLVATLALLSLGACIAASASASYVEHPTIHEGEAERHAVRVLHGYPGWRYRSYGYIDCGNGRLNRYTWACRVGWVSGRKCRQGRIRIINQYAEGGYINFDTYTVLRRC